MDENQSNGRTYRLNQIYFYLADSCNLKCRHCWISPKFQPVTRSATYLPLDTFESIIDQAIPLGLTSVKLTGGEPLLNPRIREILDAIKARGLHLNLETNGVLVNPEIAKAVASSKNPFASVSIDGLKAEHEFMRGVEGCFDDAVSGIKALVKEGINTQVIMSITRKNYRQMEDVIALARSLGCRSVKFNVIQPTSRGQGLYEAGDALGIEELMRLGRWVENELSARAGIRLQFGHPMAFRPLGKIFGSCADGCGVCGILNMIGVLADGSYSMCGIGEHIPELIYGHASADRLEDIWKSSRVLREIRDGMPGRLSGVCGDCFMKRMCLGSCIAQNYYRSKNLWAPFWFCDEARKKQLFPESRLPAGKIE